MKTLFLFFKQLFMNNFWLKCFSFVLTLALFIFARYSF